MMNDAPAHIGILYVDLFIGEARSLKGKRMVLRRLKDRIRNRFNVSIAELNGHDKWQVCTLGFTMIGNDHRYVNAALQSVVSFIESDHAVEICGQNVEFC